jgi:hypothetical protein
MSCYINATNERLYGAVEDEYGQAVTLSSADRLSFRSLRLTESTLRAARRDKTGSRTRFAPHPEVRTENRFELDCYFAGRNPGSPWDGVTNLVEATLGGPRVSAGSLIVSTVSGNPQTLGFSVAHGLTRGQGLRFQGELRFVKEVPSSTSVVLSAPFSNGLQPGGVLGTTISIWPGDKPKPLTLGDYWNPSGVVDRVLAGCVVDEMTVALNSDFHGAQFRGTAREIASVTGFLPGSTGLSLFPAEPSQVSHAFQLVPGHVGRVFLGGTEFYLLDLTLRFVNNADTATREFGQSVAACYSADLREVTVQFQLYASSDAAVEQLHVLSRLRQETDLMIQMGNQPGQLAGIYVPRFVPEIPEMRDTDARVAMNYPRSQAYGVTNDEITLAFA